MSNDFKLQGEEPVEAELVEASHGQTGPFASEVNSLAFRSSGEQRMDQAETSGIQNRLIVLGILFFVTGSLGLPLLWLNRRFSNLERIVWAIVVTAYTILLIWLVVKICIWSFEQIQAI